MKRLLVFLFCVLYAIGGKAHVDCVRDGSEHEAKRSKANSPPSSKRLESNIDEKTIELASLTRARPEGETSVSDTISLSLSSPPMLNMPFDKENIPVQLFQNINFSWTPLHMGSINAAFSTEYLFELWEIYNEQVPAQQYVQTAQPLYSTTTSSPILIYGPTMPMLIEGKRYAWRVRVQAKKGFDDLELFTNNGYSQVWSFAYAANCPEPSQVLLTSPFPDQIKVQWAYQNTYQQMKISYREAGKSKWYHETTTDPEYYITQLKDNTEYEVKIAGICTGGVETYSQPATIKTQEKGKTQIPNFNCGTPPKKLDLSNKAPLPALNAGETVTAGDFEITITEARGGGGTYSGKGYMRVPYFKLARLAITFQNVQINTSRQLIGGYFQAVYDEANGSIANIGKGVKDIVNNIQGGISGSTGAGAIVVANQYNGVIASVNDIQVSSSSVSIGGQSFPREANSTTLVQDKEGNTYGVSETGEKVQVGKQINEKIPNSGGGYSAGSDPTPLAKDKGSVTFVAHATQKYGFDLLPNPELANNYDKISGVSIPWKSVKTAGMDKVSYTGTASTGTLKFRTKAGFEYKPENGVLNIIGTKHGDIQEIYAIAYQDSTHQHVIGKLQAMTLNPIKNVIYVIPTQANQTVDKAKLKAYLDKVYDQAVMHWEVEVISQYKPTITLGDNGLDIAKDESRKDLSPEMKALRDDYLKQGLAQREDAQTYYVFLVDKFSDASIDGYFPQSKIFGFVRYASSESTLHKTLAHELGHGAGNLEHPFVQYKTTQGATPLLMDYSSGSLLTKQDWGLIHNPGIRTGWKDAVGEGQGILSKHFKICHIPQTLLSYFEKYKYFKVSTTYDEKWIELPQGAIAKEFYIYNGKLYLSSFTMTNGNEYKDNATYFADKMQFNLVPSSENQSTLYYVQLFAKSKKDNLDISKFPFLEKGYLVKEENGLYKYLFGETKNYNQAYHNAKYIQSNGIKDAFVVRYDNDIRILDKNLLQTIFVENPIQKERAEINLTKNGENNYLVKIIGKNDEFEIEECKDAFNINEVGISAKKNNHIIIFANGYRKIESVSDFNLFGSEYPNSDNSLNDTDKFNYWGAIADQFIKRLNASKSYYVDGHHSISTSQHLKMSNALMSYLSVSAAPVSEQQKEELSVLMKKSKDEVLKEIKKTGLNTGLNNKGFNDRVYNGKLAGEKLKEALMSRINNNPRLGTKDTIDIVAHSMGYAYSLGLIEKLFEIGDKIHIGRLYILAPEGAANTHNIDFSKFEEVWQYGSDETDPVYLQDGIAPQSEVYVINNKSKNPKGGRAFIPSTEPKGFITSHLGGNYMWIFTELKNPSQNGYVKPRK